MKKITLYLLKDKIFSNEKEAFDLQESQNFGEKVADKVFYMLEEAFYLFKKNKAIIKEINGRQIDKDNLMKKLNKTQKDFLTRYIVYEELKNKGYRIKSGFKFGTDFRIYEKNKKKNKHSRWLCNCVNEREKYSWIDFSSKVRVSHSTRKKLLVAIIDQENKITFYESSWQKI